MPKYIHIKVNRNNAQSMNTKMQQSSFKYWIKLETIIYYTRYVGDILIICITKITECDILRQLNSSVWRL